MDTRNLIPEDLSPEELEKDVADYILRDDPSTGDLPVDTFMALWQRFEAERRAQVIELEQDILGGEVVLSVAPTNVAPVEVKGNEIHLEDGRRIVLRLRRPIRLATDSAATGR